MQTFLSDLEAPDLVHPVVYSPYSGVEDRSGGEYAKLLTVPPVPVIGDVVNRWDDVSTRVLTHQQVELVQVGHDELCTLSPVSCRLSHRIGVVFGMSGPELME